MKREKAGEGGERGRWNGERVRKKEKGKEKIHTYPRHAYLSQLPMVTYEPSSSFMLPRRGLLFLSRIFNTKKIV